MSRIPLVQIPDAPPATRSLLQAVQRRLGMVPNVLKTMAQSPPVLAGYLQVGERMEGLLDAALRAQVALTVAGANESSYDASAHTALGARAGVDPDELAANLRGESRDARTRAVLRFARAVVARRGRVDDDDVSRIRAAGFTNTQIVEIVALVAVSLFTNYLNHVAATDIDFRAVDATGADA